MRLDEIQAPAVNSFAGALAKRGVQSKGPVMLLKTVLRAGVRAGRLTVMPEIPRVWEESGKLPDSPPGEDVKTLLRESAGWLQITIALASMAGLRSGETRAIEVRDIDLAGGRILIRRSLSEDEVTTPKSGHERVVPIIPALRPYLEQAVGESRKRDAWSSPPGARRQADSSS
jgi:integrase